MKAMIFAAGLGSRLRPLTNHIPKALVKINGKTLLEHAIGYLQHYAIYDVIVNIHHFAPLMERTIVENKGFGSRVTISDERDEVLETGGGLLKAAHFFAGERDFVVINVDVLTNLDLAAMITAHWRSGAQATLAVMNRSSSRHLLFNPQMQLCGWVNNGTGEQRMARQEPLLTPFAFSGIQVLSGSVLNNIPFHGKFSLIDLYLHLAATQNLVGFNHTGDLFLDVGKPESIEKAEELFLEAKRGR
jgi:NDP-sugar pyrophosphorylase family protein